MTLRFIAPAMALCLAASIQAHAAEHMVKQSDKTFDTNEISVAVGDVVQFRNDDTITHNVMSSTPGHQFNAGSQQPGHVLKVKFDKAGKIDVRCAMHPKMKMSVNVQ